MKYLSKIIFITILTLTITSCNEEEFNSDTYNQNANISTLIVYDFADCMWGE